MKSETERKEQTKIIREDPTKTRTSQSKWDYTVENWEKQTNKNVRNLSKSKQKERTFAGSWTIDSQTMTTEECEREKRESLRLSSCSCCCSGRDGWEIILIEESEEAEKKIKKTKEASPHRIFSGFLFFHEISNQSFACIFILSFLLTFLNFLYLFSCCKLN